MTDAIERVARAIALGIERHDDVHAQMMKLQTANLNLRIAGVRASDFDIIRYNDIKSALWEIQRALAPLRPGDKITLADGTECWMAPMEPTSAMRAAAVAADDRRTGNETCAHIFRAMRDACKEDEG